VMGLCGLLLALEICKREGNMLADHCIVPMNAQSRIPEIAHLGGGQAVNTNDEVLR